MIAGLIIGLIFIVICIVGSLCSNTEDEPTNNKEALAHLNVTCTHMMQLLESAELVLTTKK